MIRLLSIIIFQNGTNLKLKFQFYFLLPLLFKIVIMNIEQHKSQIIKKVQSIQDEKLLEEIDVILNGLPIVAYTIDGKALNKSQYIKHVENISKSIENGAETFTSEQVRDFVLLQK